MGPFMEAAHAGQPQVVTFGGTVLTSPKIQVISYASDPFAADVDAMVKEFGSTSEWSDQTSEYGIGAFTILPTISLTGQAPASFNDDTGNVTPFQQTLINNITGTNPAWGAADPNTIYLFLLPLNTDISSGGHCCTDFLGYHYEAPIDNNTEVPYAIVCHCAAQQGDPLTPLQFVTTTVNHEMVESATDPFSNANPAYAQSDNNDIIWTIATGGEVSDMCEYNVDSNYQPPGAKYMIQRSWSNAAAKAGQNPCVPVPATGPYFNSSPVLPDTVHLNNFGQSVATKGVKIAKGSSKTIEVQLWSTAKTAGPWTITAYDLNYYLTGQNNQANSTVTFMETGMSTATGSNGDTLHLTIHLTSTDPQSGGAGFVLQSDIGMGADLQENLSMGAVAPD
jgi:hypothetical protein